MMRCPSASRTAACLLNSIARNGATAWVRSASLIRRCKPRSWAISRNDAISEHPHARGAAVCLASEAGRNSGEVNVAGCRVASAPAPGEQLNSTYMRNHEPSMRPTVTLEPDLPKKTKALAPRRKLSFKQALNEVIRRGLTTPDRHSAQTRFTVQPHAGGFRPGIDPGKLNQ